jgi:hypothetical protein
MRALTRACLALQLAAAAVVSSPSLAFDLNGAWATDAANCEKIFAKKGNAIAYRSRSELHGSGFIIEANKIRGRTANCVIKTRRQAGDIIHLLAGCATDVMLSSMQFSLRIVNENKVLRIFPGMEGMELAYDRCSL